MSKPSTVPHETLDVAGCERFLVHEARLLDDARFDEWLDLFTADAWYWVPSEPDQANPHDTVSLIYDDRRLLETRVRRLASPRMYSQEPRSRTSRMVGNVTVEESDDDGKAVTVRSKFLMLEFRRDQQRLFGGTAFHRLVRPHPEEAPTGPASGRPDDRLRAVSKDGGIRIAWKRVNLINCDAPLDGITQPF